MSREAVLLRGAETDLQVAFGRYEDKVEGLGEEFLLTIDGSLTAIVQFPELAPVYHKTVRRLVVNRFPYGVFYAVEGRRIVVHAVLDLRQDPRSIRKRLG
jgi:plasmid stabilization system protein ParE